ncbi:MAG TPA: thioredoxin family protein [Phycisphaerae bacterium]|nr:thioredoxin family protein [Phycisphaerales bacterium]HRX85139.1 thioredoxin family protein [Phycisphaerae bacterium]
MTKKNAKLWLCAASALVFTFAGADRLLADGGGSRHGAMKAPDGAKVGEKAPDFTLKDTDGKEHSLSDYTAQGKIVVLEWFNSGCPFIQMHHQKESTLADLYKDFSAKDVVFLAINSTNSEHPDFGKDAQAKKDWNIEYPILEDTDGKVGHAYGAKTTPHMFVIGKDGKLVYSGALDNDPRNTKSGSEKVNYVRSALDDLEAGKPVATAETKPYGCGVKY